MKSKNIVIILLSTALLFPMFPIAGKYINIAEPLGIFFLLALLFHRVTIKKHILIKAYYFYFWGYFVVVVLVMLISSTGLVSSDIYVLRKILQFIAYFIVMSFLINRIEGIEQTSTVPFINTILTILTIPAIITFLQISDLGGIREFSYKLYRPTYYVNPSKIFYGITYFYLNLPRVTSVFKDFFTATVYFTVVSIFIYYLILTDYKKRFNKIYLVTLFAINYVAQFYTSRSGLLFTPLMLILLVFIWIDKKNFVNVLRNNSKAIMAILLFGFLFYALYLRHNLYKMTWALEVLKVFDPQEIKDVSSIMSMNENNITFLSYISDNLDILFVPKHIYLSYYQNYRYTVDSYYLQEIYRFGIYGITLFMFFFISLLKKTRKNAYIVTIIVFLGLINIKGGNSFFMDKNNFIYAILFTLSIYHKKNYNSSNKYEKNTLLNDANTSSTRQRR